MNVIPFTVHGCKVAIRRMVIRNSIVIGVMLALLASTCTAVAKTEKKTEELLPPQPAEMLITRQQTTVEELPDEVKKLLKKYRIPEDNLSIYIRDLTADAPNLVLNIDELRSPASTMKLVTTYAALKELDPNYTWKTQAWLRGKLDEGVLDGDLILKGYGDPFLVYENFWKFVHELREKGLREIKGNIIIDNSFYDLPKHDPAAFDNKPLRVYNTAPSALMFNFQATRFLIRPDKKNERIDVIPYPWVPGFTYVNQLEYKEGRCRRSHYRPRLTLDETKNLVIKGKYSPECGQHYIMRVISTPEKHAFNAFRDFWRDLSGSIGGGLKRGQKQTGDTLFHTHHSRTLGEQIRTINKWSNNVMTRQLLLTIGAKRFGVPGTIEKGRKAIREIFQENKIDTTDFIIDNGSGLSRTSRITARQMGQLLETAWRDEYMPEFLSSMSLSGLDGTLLNRFRKSDLRGRSHMKTGTLNHVTALSGYMLNRNGKWMVVVIQHNGRRTGGGRGAKIQNALLRWAFEQ